MTFMPKPRHMSQRVRARRRARTATRSSKHDPFSLVRSIGLTLPGVEATRRYDGSPVLKLGGCYMAGLAAHPSAEPDTLVVRMSEEERALLLEDAPDTYYVTDYYRPYPLVLVRLGRVTPEALHDLLSVSWRLTQAKVRRRRATGERP